MKFSQCCGAGVKEQERQNVLKYYCRLCGQTCVAVITEDEGCPICDGPISTNFNEGKAVEYCWMHGDVATAQKHAAVVLCELEEILNALRTASSIASGDCESDPEAVDDFITDCDALIGRITY